MSSTELITRFTEAKQKLATAKSEYDAATFLKDSFISESLKLHLSKPSGVTGYVEQTSPLSALGLNYRDKVAQGWTLKDMRPQQFSVVMVWQPKDLTKKEIESRCKELAQAEWCRHIQPIEERLSYAQYEYDQAAAELTALKEAIQLI
ncbi:hypothetical protein [Citrobacter portucalensis]|uniref:hypothetical protein n=1 Tax=Citrobacter portucalensis TaxID=1639133 RepID=UPI00226BA5D6|nr:hypothetical protein [Citrobacter portucalensis]MCX9047065.1 hypothetical protein [Citrobacter portucalensis]